MFTIFQLRKPKVKYFSQLASEAENLSALAQKYLDQFQFMSTEDMMEKIYNNCWRIFKESGEDFEKIPEQFQDAVNCVIDGAMPYYTTAMEPGSLNKTIGLSLVSVDAHLRNLLERLEGRTNEKLNFGIIAEVKKFRINSQIGNVRHSVSFYDGSTHKDGSPFWQLIVAKNKKELNQRVKELQDKGYFEES